MNVKTTIARVKLVKKVEVVREDDLFFWPSKPSATLRRPQDGRVFLWSSMERR